jgi:hypothetical protein
VVRSREGCMSVIRSTLGGRCESDGESEGE